MLFFRSKRPSAGQGGAAPRKVREDRTIYTQELRALRDTLRANGGFLCCLNCGRRVQIDLEAIERQIRHNRELLRRMKAMGGRQVDIVPDAGDGAVCKACRGVLCGDCSKEAAEQPTAALFGAQCPKCHGRLEGIDHITD